MADWIMLRVTLGDIFMIVLFGGAALYLAAIFGWAFIVQTWERIRNPK
jgi:hypothetical protein